MNWRVFVGSIVAALAGLKIFSDLTVRRAKKKMPPIGRFVTVDGVRLHYLSKGSGRRLTPQWVGVGLLLMGILLFWSGCTALVCSKEERRVLAEFPQYGGAQVTPEGNFDTGACAVYYDVADPADQVRSYFVEQLTAHDWTVEAVPPAGTLVQAQRGQFSYIIYSETTGAYPGPGTHLAVHVGQD